MKIWRFIAGFLLAANCCTPVYAQDTRAQMNMLNNAVIVPNGVGAITASNLNPLLGALINGMCTIADSANCPISALSGLGTGVLAGLGKAVNSAGGFITEPGGGQALSGSGENTTATCVSTNTTVTLSAAIDFANGQGIGLEHCGATFSGATPTGLTVSATGLTFQGPTGSTTYSYQVACVDDNGGVSPASAAVTITNGAATLGAVVQSSSPTMAWNAVSWTTSCPAVAVWRNIASAGYHLIGVFTNIGLGTLIYDNGLPQVTIPWIPDTPPASALNDRLVTTIVSGGGTTSLTVASAPTNAATGAYARHDDTAALNTYLAANVAPSLEAGTFNVEALTLPTTVASLKGAGAGATTINGWNVAEPAVLATGMPNGFSMSGVAIYTEAMGTPIALEVASTSYCQLSDMILSGNIGLYLSSDAHCHATRLSVPAWYTYGVDEDSGSSNETSQNYLAMGRMITIGDGIVDISGASDNIHDNSLNGTFFGILLVNTNYTRVMGNNIYSSWREGLHLSQNAEVDTLEGNLIDGSTESIDYCVSMSNDGVSNITEIQNRVADNHLTNCGNSAIAIGYSPPTTGSSTGLDFGFNVITGNSMINQNLDGFSGHAAILLIGGQITFTMINDNTLIIGGGAAAYHVQELTANSLLPDHTQVGTMYGQPGTTAMVSLSGTGSVALTAATTTNSTGQ